MIGIIFVLAVILTLIIIHTVRNRNNQESKVRSIPEEISVPEVHEDVEDIPVVSDEVYKAYTENYNFQRAMELMGDNEEEEAFNYLKKALQDDENNGYAHAWIGRIYLRHGHYGMALKAVNNAIRCLPDENQAWLYVIRSRVYRGLQDDACWKRDSETACSLDPKNSQALEELADYYYQKEDYSKSDEVIGKFIELEPHNPYGYMVKGRNEMSREHYDEALSLFDYAERLDEEYGPALAFKAEMLFRLNRLSESVDSLLEAFQLIFTKGEENQKAVYVRSLIAKKACDILSLKIKSKIAVGDLKDRWLGMLGVVYSSAGRYIDAANCYRELYMLDHKSITLSFESFCWRKAGDFKRATILLEKALSDDPDNYDYMENLLILKGELGLFEDAISIGDKMVSIKPDNPLAYYNRGRMKQMNGDHQAAIQDYDTVLTLTENKNAFAFFYRGLSNLLLNNKEKADCDFTSVIENNDLEGREQFLMLSLLFRDGALVSQENGNAELSAKFSSALEGLDNYVQEEIQKSQESPHELKVAIESLIIRASVMCYSGAVDKALTDVRKALELGGNRFYYYRHTFLLRPLQNNPDFVQLIENYEKKVKLSLPVEEEDTADRSENIFFEEEVDIPFVKEGVMCKVACAVNSLPLHFIFDTGASDVSMSTVEASFMLKNGYLKPQDLSGKEYYMTASGEIAEGTKVKLREVVFGGLKLTNVKASIVKSQNAPLLLGQSVLQQLGKIQIDNEKSIIKVIR